MILEGIYQKTMYRNIKTAFTIFSFKTLRFTENGKNFFVCCGNIPRYATKTPLKLTGSTQTRNREEVFVVDSAEISINSEQLLHSFIVAHLEKGMGDVCAERLVAYLKINQLTFEELLQKDDALQRLVTIKGFEEKKSRMFLKKAEETLSELQLLNKLSPYGISCKKINKLCSLFKKNTTKEIDENPYKAMRMAGIAFENADAYAKAHGFTYCDHARIRELTSLVYFRMANTGNAFCRYEEIISLFRETERRLSCFEEQIPIALVLLELFSNRNGYIDYSGAEPLFYSKKAYLAESNIVGRLQSLMNCEEPLLSRSHIEEYLREEGDFLDVSQKEAFRLLEDTRPCFLIGGPGTGKTTTIKNIVACIKKYCPNKRISICAPTGRAAERIKEATGYFATTIHVLLEYLMIDGYGQPARNENNPIDSDLVIIDEFSMVGIFLFSSFLSAVPNNTKLIFVGDWNQLPSVEPGFLLHDLVESGCFPYHKLTSTHRQGKDSSIAINRDKILAGDIDLTEDDHFEIQRFGNNQEAMLVLEKIYRQYYDCRCFQNFHVLSPQKSGLLGVKEVNLFAQGLFHNTDEPYMSYGNMLFYRDDKVMTVRNCYDEDLSYFNGDLWTVADFVDNEELVLETQDNEFIRMKEEHLEDVSLAYAMTIHKCQGSEGDVIVILLPDDVSRLMITKSLLYTAVTRAKKKLIILSVGNTLERFIRSEMHPIRNSGITEKIEKSHLQSNKDGNLLKTA